MNAFIHGPPVFSGSAGRTGPPRGRDRLSRKAIIGRGFFRALWMVGHLSLIKGLMYLIHPRFFSFCWALCCCVRVCVCACVCARPACFVLRVTRGIVR